VILIFSVRQRLSGNRDGGKSTAEQTIASKRAIFADPAQFRSAFQQSARSGMDLPGPGVTALPPFII
jgi:hypothetical protein